MKVLRTPDERFSNITDFPYAQAYAQITAADGTGLRMHYVDVGPRHGELILCLHGQPTWSYLYRHMIPLLTGAGFRVVAPDLIGFGRSDKPALRSDYTYAAHVGWMRSFIEALDLTDITLMCQDWGGLIGLRVVTEVPQRFARIVVANTGLPDARGIPDAMTKVMRDLFATIPALPPHEMGAKLRANEFGAGFMYWIKCCSEYPDFTVSDVVNLSAGGTHTLARAGHTHLPRKRRTTRRFRMSPSSRARDSSRHSCQSSRMIPPLRPIGRPGIFFRALTSPC